MLLYVWRTNPTQWARDFRDISTGMRQLAFCFHKASEGKCTLENARDKVRKSLNQKNPMSFPMGHVGASVALLAHEMTISVDFLATFSISCNICGTTSHSSNDRQTLTIETPQVYSGSTAEFVQELFEHSVVARCNHCEGDMRKIVKFKKPPTMLMVTISSGMSISKELGLESGDEYRLAGIAYHGGFHFVCRIITTNKQIMIHDGMVTGRMCREEGILENMSEYDLMTCGGKAAVLGVYVKC